MEELSDEEVIKLCLEDSVHYEIIVARYQLRLRKFAYIKFTRNHQDAEDITQEALVRGFLSIRRFDLSKKWQPWIYQIAANVGCNYLRDNKRISFVSDCGVHEPSGGILEDEIDVILSQERIRVCLKRVDPKYREVLALYYLENKSNREICSMLNISAARLKILLARAHQEFSVIYSLI